jgi:hypothetical protein
VRALGWIRTSDTRRRRTVLYSAELRGPEYVRAKGFEPPERCNWVTANPDSPTSAHPHGLTCPHQGSNLGRPVCRTGALPLSYTGHANRAPETIRTPDLPGRNRALSPLSYKGMTRARRDRDSNPEHLTVLRVFGTRSSSSRTLSRRTQGGIRTPNLRILSAVPLPVELPRPAWTTAVSNRARAVCKTALHTGASPCVESSCWG